MLATVEAHVRRLLALEAADDGGSTLDDWADDAPVLGTERHASLHRRRREPGQGLGSKNGRYVNNSRSGREGANISYRRPSHSPSSTPQLNMVWDNRY